MSETQWHILIFMAIVAVSLEGLLLVGVARQLGSVLLLVHPPRPGTMDMGPALGDLVESPHLERARPGVLVFVAPGCGVCDQLKPSIPAFARSYRDIQKIVFTGPGAPR